MEKTELDKKKGLRRSIRFALIKRIKIPTKDIPDCCLAQLCHVTILKKQGKDWKIKNRGFESLTSRIFKAGRGFEKPHTDFVVLVKSTPDQENTGFFKH